MFTDLRGSEGARGTSPPSLLFGPGIRQLAHEDNAGNPATHRRSSLPSLTAPRGFPDRGRIWLNLQGTEKRETPTGVGAPLWWGLKQTLGGH